MRCREGVSLFPLGGVWERAVPLTRIFFELEKGAFWVLFLETAVI